MPTGIYERNELEKTRLRNMLISFRSDENIKKKIKDKMIGHSFYGGMLGKHHTNESRKKMSEIAKTQKRKPPSYEGWKHSEETKNKMRIKKLGHISTPKQLEALELGRKYYPYERRKAIAERKKGENCIFWKGGISAKNRSIRDNIMETLEYKEWRRAVFKRDNYTCQNCGKRGGRLNADHIKPFILYPELILNVDNGRTLCVECHKKIGWKHRNGNKKNNMVLFNSKALMGNISVINQ